MQAIRFIHSGTHYRYLLVRQLFGRRFYSRLGSSAAHVFLRKDECIEAVYLNDVLVLALLVDRCCGFACFEAVANNKDEAETHRPVKCQNRVHERYYLPYTQIRR